MTTLTLAQRLLAANKDLGWIAKTGNNKEQQYKYVEAVAIFDAVRDALNNHGVVFSHSVTEQKVTVIQREGRSPQYLTELAGEYTFINADDKNDVQAGTWVGQALDTSDKGTWKAITGGLKYIFIANQLLPTGDDPENDSGAADQKPADKKPSSPIPPTQKATDKPAATTAEGLTDKQRALLMATLRDRGVTVKEAQQYVLKKACGKHSTKQMDSADLDKVLEAIKDDDLVLEAMASLSA